LPLKIRFAEPLRDARVRTNGETYRSERSLRAEIEERYRAGYDAGQKAIGEELIRQRTQLLEIQTNILRSIERTLPTLAGRCEKELIELAMLAARRVVQGMPITAELVEATVKAGLTELQGTTEYQVHLHPEDYALLQTIQSPVLPNAQSKSSFVADPAVARAGCVILTRHGAIALDREKMFKKLEEAAL
jgi:flagellar biosynthesis/type III secretory pathway protein FliH